MLAMDIGHRFGRIGRRGSDGRPTVAIRLLGQGGDPPDPQVALAALLDIAPGGIAPNGQEVALGLSAFEPQELALLRAAEQAGLTVRHSVPEPVAAAVHYGAVAEGVDRSVLVCDQGATRLDLTVLTVTPDRTVRIVETRSRQLGGDDWDRAVAVDLLRQLPALLPVVALFAVVELAAAIAVACAPDSRADPDLAPDPAGERRPVSSAVHGEVRNDR